MQKDWPDILGGLVLATLGAAAAGWALAHYDIGSLRRMGPGFFPVVLGALLAGLGLAIALPALGREAGPRPGIEPRAAVAVLAAILVFGFGLFRLGLVGATAAAVLIAALPAPHGGRAWRLVLALAISALTVLVFGLGLRMNVPLWPRLS
ncbi:tripartite tricarboxylate transporter TctB family protein [Rhodovulum sulfidophilum]|uniref:tripartite tricarboxylate transporter TctB family protein n=1 Tax=Rhodovulum sulfidophilum TaxID=35806 RepID=UPI001921B063|nr:tripartite tricarboxylate transporter TctB family protein [Rhodovulum sulfidophilum]MBL3567257.1 tripartite tricarboxylate transporter TctB family protein [Rhodovulum sulfidophilum]MBL3574439.1 tripartite tricarboxylate transporter TctB family protein [Rhodovulum sulfidophilum]MCE8432488.1 tripartite tricarboxylate transporter TctB family protein [Rhodovulum sulfidophilum]MCF4116337.1 tripartite tricarboxylate transporter TctB family protein [Rhodovulum sulfidophilum]